MGNVYYYGTPIGDSRWVAPNMPSFNFPGITGWPALPNDARGFRVRVGGGTQTDPDTSQRWIDPSNFSRPRQFLIDRFPLLIDAPLLETRSCHYELSVTRNFYIDTHPEWSNVWIAGGGSAEGFKFGPVVGDYTAKRVMGIEGDPAIAKAFRIPKEEFEEPPRTAADSARVKARADSVAKAKPDSAKADSAKRVIPDQHAPSAPKPDPSAEKPLATGELGGPRRFGRALRLSAKKRRMERLYDFVYAGGWPSWLAKPLGLQGRLRLTTHQLTIANDGAPIPPLRIAFASDLHGGPGTHPATIRRACRLLAEAKPDYSCWAATSCRFTRGTLTACSRRSTRSTRRSAGSPCSATTTSLPTMRGSCGVSRPLVCGRW